MCTAAQSGFGQATWPDNTAQANQSKQMHTTCTSRYITGLMACSIPALLPLLGSEPHRLQTMLRRLQPVQRWLVLLVCQQPATQGRGCKKMAQASPKGLSELKSPTAERVHVHCSNIISCMLSQFSGRYGPVTLLHARTQSGVPLTTLLLPLP